MSNGVIAVAEEFCRYTGTKIDVEVLSRARAAAALEELPLQEWLSNVINAASAKIVRREPIKRKPPPPHPKRPRKDE